MDHLRHHGLVTAFIAVLAIGSTAGAQVQPIDCATELYASTQTGEILAVNTATGGSRVLSSIQVPVEGQPMVEFATECEYDFVTDGLWYESTNGFTDLVRVDPMTGQILETVDHGPVSLAGMEFVNGTLYAAVIGIGGGGGGDPEGGQGGSVLATVDLATGNLNTVGPITAPSVISGLAYNASTDTLYGITAGGLPADLIIINRSTGQSNVVGSTGYSRIGSIEFGPDGFLYGGTTETATPNANALVRINPATGATSLVGAGSFSITGLAACQEQVQPVEPAIPTATPVGIAVMTLLMAAAALILIRHKN